MKEKNKIIIAIAAIALIIIIAGGATFAYWYWETATNEETTINLVIPGYPGDDEDATPGDPDVPYPIAQLTGATQNITNLIPVASCTDSTYAIKKELTLIYSNNTDNEAIVRGTLSVSNFNSPHGTPDSTDLSHLHYAVTTSSTSCTSNAVTGASGTFGTTNGALFSNVTLLSGINAYTTAAQQQKYYLWVWIDSGYTHTNVGSGVVNDPMQDISFDLTWTGTISNDT